MCNSTLFPPILKTFLALLVLPLSLAAAAAPFAHGAVHQAGALKLYDSYHCSRYNTNTRVLTPDMFRSVFARVRADLDK